MHSKDDNIETKINDKAYANVEQLFESPVKRYQSKLERSIRVSDFIFDCVLYYKCHYIIS